MALLWKWHRYRRELGVSPVELLVLLLLTERQKYGYEITQELRKWFSGCWIPHVGTIYHALRRLEKKGFTTSSVHHREKGLDRRLYTLTEKGEVAIKRGVEHFRKQIEVVQHIVDLIDKYIEPKNERNLESSEKKSQKR